MTEPLLRVEGLTKHFPVTRGVFGRVVGQVRAIDDLSFDIAHGETLGLVGESGCGKTTVGRSVLRLIQPTAGRVLFEGRDVTRVPTRELTRLRRDLQVIFQDPFSSLNPRMRVVDLVGEALEVHGLARGPEVERVVAELLRRVGLSPSWINRYPHEFSGGQRQRIGIARAIALQPKLIVCDEAVSALDVSIQAQVINLLIELRREMNLSYLFIAHDLSVVRHVSHRIAVMYLGELVELGPSKRLFEAPAHPYTRALLSAIPVPVPGRQTRRLVLHGDVPTPLNPPAGCRFHTRCPAVTDRCRNEVPPSVEVEPGHVTKCVHAEGLTGASDWYAQLSGRIEHATARNDDKPVTVADVNVPLAEALVARSTGDVETAENDPEFRHWGSVGGAVVTLGAAMMLLGAWATGLFVAGTAYLALVRPTIAGKRRSDAVLVIGMLASILTGTAITHARMRASARRQLGQLSTELSARETLTGAVPKDLSELGWRLYPLFEGGRTVDPWGRPWRYRAPGTEGRPFDLGSTGPDGVPGRDDIGHVPP